MPSFKTASSIIDAAHEIEAATRDAHAEAHRLRQQVDREYILGPIDDNTGKHPRLVFYGSQAVHNVSAGRLNVAAEIRRAIQLEFHPTAALLRKAADIVAHIEQWAAGEINDLQPSGKW